MTVSLVLRYLAAGVVVLALAMVPSSCSRRPAAPAVAGLPDVIDFNFHVKPILSDRCFKCHGPDDRVRKAGLRFDRKEAAFGVLPSGNRAIVPGDTGRSTLVARILSTDPQRVMPAGDSNLTLNEYEKAMLMNWIEQGAEWKPHWSFIPPRKVPPPAVKTRAGSAALRSLRSRVARGGGPVPRPKPRARP